MIEDEMAIVVPAERFFAWLLRDCVDDIRDRLWV